MSGVDVLAALDGEIADRRRDGDTGNVENLIEARAAVADMVESLKLIESAKERGFGIDYAQGCASAALARCRGGES